MIWILGTIARRRLKFLVLPLLASFFFLFCMRQITQEILLFESMLLSILITILFVLILYWVRREREFKQFAFEDLLAIVLSLVLFYSISGSTILNVDRSKSFYVLSWVHDYGPISENELAQRLQSKYGAYDSISINQRLVEQTSRGVLVFRGGRYQTSVVGDIYWYVATGIASIFKLSGWYSAKLP